MEQERKTGSESNKDGNDANNGSLTACIYALGFQAMLPSVRRYGVCINVYVWVGERQ